MKKDLLRSAKEAIPFILALFQQCSVLERERGVEIYLSAFEENNT